MNRILPFFLLIFFFSCDQDSVYEEVKNIENNEWISSDSLAFNINIEDTLTDYNIYYDVRYNDAFPFHNLYVTQTLVDSAGNTITSDMQEMILFDKKTGHPLGSGYGNTLDHRILSRKKYNFPYEGNYIIKVDQHMRKDTLKGISGFGIVIKKFTPETEPK